VLIIVEHLLWGEAAGPPFFCACNPVLQAGSAFAPSQIEKTSKQIS